MPLKKSTEIVIVNVSEDILRIYGKYFQIAGLKVIATFSNAKDTLSFFGSHKAGLEDTVVILDSRMPDMDSYETAREDEGVEPGAENNPHDIGRIHPVSKRKRNYLMQ